MTTNQELAHQGKRCQGKTPMQTFINAKALAQKTNLENEDKLVA
jgi:hypothetical protein